MIKVAVSGCQGRMGQRILNLTQEDKNFKISGLLEHEDHPMIDHKLNNVPISADAESLKGSHVLIEFTTPTATIVHLKACLKHKVKMVIGTTGLSDNDIKTIKAASKKIPIVFSSNMSVGVNILFKVAREVAAKTKEAYGIKIVEAHHIHKKDKPSGTAKSLLKIVEEASGQKVTNVESIREGEIIGDHDVIFESSVDKIIIGHRAKTRDIFAKGSLVAAKFVAKKAKGLFDMQDVLGLK